MTNSFLAMKVIYCNEMYDLCQKLGLNYNNIRELWVADPRIGSSHTFVFEENRGFGGSCFPKDTAALIYSGKENNSNLTLLETAVEKNKEYKKC